MSSMCNGLRNCFKTETELKLMTLDVSTLESEGKRGISNELRVEAWQKRRSGHSCLFFGAVGALAAIIATGGVALGGGIVAGILILLALCLYARALNLRSKANKIHCGIKDQQ